MKNNLSLFIIVIFFLFDCSELVEIEDISTDSVIVLAPVNNVTLANNSVSFSWQALEFADEYQLQIARPNFDNAEIIVEDVVVTTTQHTSVLEAGSYQWRIKAINFAYETDYTTYNLTIED